MSNYWEYLVLNIVIHVVGTRFSAQAQNVWDIGPVNPVQ